MQFVDAFSISYAQAREKFLQGASAVGLPVQSYPHPLTGCDGELLALDAVLDGAPNARQLMIVSSGCHGVEGYCGSGVQVFALNDTAFRSQCADAGIAVLYLHAINPYGFSHTRRVTHENVDLNRNFQDFSKPLPQNPAYQKLHSLLLPTHWPPGLGNTAAIGWHILTQGMKSAQAAVSGGQYEVLDGLFFGGVGPSWSNLTLRQILRDYGGKATEIAWIDLHSGLGATGHCERTYAMKRGDAQGQRRASDWWSGAGATPLKSLDDGSSVSSALTGLMWSAIYDECPKAEVTAMAMEFGTAPVMQVLTALRGDQWLSNHPNAPPKLAAAIKKALRDAFYVDTPEWKEKIVKQGTQAMAQAFGKRTVA